MSLLGSDMIDAGTGDLSSLWSTGSAVFVNRGALLLSRPEQLSGSRLAQKPAAADFESREAAGAREPRSEWAAHVDVLGESLQGEDGGQVGDRKGRVRGKSRVLQEGAV